MTIRQRLTRRILLVVSVPLLVALVAVYLWVAHELVENFDAALRAKAFALAALTHGRGAEIRLETSNRVTRDFEGDPDADGRGGAFEANERAYFQMWDQSGAVIRRSPTLGPTALLLAARPPATPRFMNLALPSGRSGRAFQLTFVPTAELAPSLDPKPSGTAIGLLVAVDREELDETERIVALVLAGAGLTLLGLTFLLVPRVVTREFAPIGMLAEQTGLITAESLGTRFPVATLPDELAPIAARLNDLLARLEQAFERERQFSADLAHELRTPIAELRSLAELGLKWPDARPEHTDRDALAIALQMEGIVSRLLMMLRAERGQMPMTPASVDLAVLARDRWQPLAARAASRGLRLQWQPPADAMISSDLVLLSSILTNLLDNAVAYAARDSVIRITLVIEPQRFVFCIDNDAPGLTGSDIEAMFSRFWRSDRARTGTDHSGLGLTLARAFATALSCELRAQLDGSRLKMTLSGPRALPA